MEWIKRNLLFTRSKIAKKEGEAVKGGDTDEFIVIIGDEHSDSGTGISCLLADPEDHANNTSSSIDTSNNANTNSLDAANAYNNYIPQPQAPSQSTSNQSQTKPKHSKPLIYSQSSSPTSAIKKKQPSAQLKSCVIHQPK